MRMDATHPDTHKIRVFLDGKNMMDCMCFAFDTAEGWVDIRVFDKSGRKVIHNGDIVTHRLYGEVTYQTREGAE